jgi:hypothetical protein
MSISGYRRAILALAAGLVAISGLWAYEMWQNQRLRSLAYGLSRVRGIVRARQDFLDGKVQLFTIQEPFASHMLTRTNDGPFEIAPISWNPNVFMDRYLTEGYVEAYNTRMRSMHDHPERWMADIGTNAQGRIVWAEPY